VVNLDGRVQRLRPAIGRPGAVRAEWQVLAELERRCVESSRPIGATTLHTSPMATVRLVEAVPFYAGLTLEEIGGRGVRWQERAAAAAVPEGPAGPFDAGQPAAPVSPNGKLRLGTYRSIWAAPEVELSPALKFLTARQQEELAPADAERLGLTAGDRVRIGGEIEATVVLRGNAPAGTVFVCEATAEDSATLLGDPQLVEVTPA
jgi:NADH-quinone oxidoreductase subunit G